MSEPAPENNPESGAAFPYKPLKAGEIRLVTIKPARTGEWSDPIHCSLSNHSLVTPPPSETAPRFEWGDYVALSYSWGWDAQVPSHQIEIDGDICKITESLDAALRSLRLSQVGTTIPVKFWVDALCINQSDPEEVKAEILRMRDIYSQALRVFAHLGVENEETDLAFRLVNGTFKQLSQGYEHAYRALVKKRVSPSDEERRAYLAMLKLFNRPYWHRVWVLQELAMSQGSMAVQCGAAEMYLDQIRDVSRFVCLNQENIVILLGGDFNAQVSQLFGMPLTIQMYTLMWATREQKVHYLPPATLDPKARYDSIRHPLLVLAQSAQASRPHDNVYGLLGIMPEAIREKMSAYVDYGLPVDKVFTAFSKTIIEYTEHLDIIFAKNFRQTMTPSWSTDWTMAVDRACFPHDWELYCYDQFDGAYDDLREVIESSAQYRADKGRKARVTFIPDDNTDTLLLKCYGTCIGEVDGLGIALRSDFVDHDRPGIIQPSSTLTPYADDAAASRALIHTIFGNPTWGDTSGAALFHIPWIAHHEDPSTYLKPDGMLNLLPEDIAIFTQLRNRGWETALGNSFFSFEWWRRGLSQFMIRGKRFEDFFSRDICDCMLPEPRFRVDIGTAMGASVGRCLVTLDTGHFGLAPYTSERGDKVFVIEGCSIPIVLRPAGETGRFTVVGECFVDGYGNGEAWDAVERGASVIQEVLLC